MAYSEVLLLLVSGSVNVFVWLYHDFKESLSKKNGTSKKKKTCTSHWFKKRDNLLLIESHYDFDKRWVFVRNEIRPVSQGFA